MNRNPGAPAGDLIGEYLDMVRTRLHTTPGEAGRILAEAEDHLRQAVADGLAAGLTKREAQEAAISSFGSVNAVVRAHNARLWRHPSPALLRDLVLAAWKLGSLALIAVGASGLVVAAMNRTAGRAFVGASATGTRFPASACHYWLSAWHGAHSCAQAATLESSSDGVVLRVLAGVFGVALLAAYFLARKLLRRWGWEAGTLPDAFFPAAAVCAFGAATAGLAFFTLNRLADNRAILGFTGGPGAFLSGGIVTLAVAVAYLWPLRRALVRSSSCPPRLRPSRS